MSARNNDLVCSLQAQIFLPKCLPSKAELLDWSTDLKSVDAELRL